MKRYNVIGVMSGTSMDGLDIAHVTLTEADNGKWNFTINKAKTVEYGDVWRLRLSKLRHQNSLIFHKTDRYFGQYIGIEINKFLQENKIEADLIASHGHTVFHQPEDNLSVQVGDGNAIHAVTGLPVVANFRALDVILGGEGAPLVGYMDSLLFSDYDLCLNLGGFANISSHLNKEGLAYDVCPANIVLNRLAREFDKEFDENGEIAAKGNIDYDLLDELNAIPYYEKSAPKSMGREWISTNFWDIVRASECSKEDKMKTLCDHIGMQIGRSIDSLTANQSHGKKILITGGGAFNLTLVEHIKNHTDAEVIIPSEMEVKYKEALCFGLLGVLRVQNRPNILKHYTGANRDSVAGSLHGDFSKL